LRREQIRLPQIREEERCGFGGEAGSGVELQRPLGEVMVMAMHPTVVLINQPGSVAAALDALGRAGTRSTASPVRAAE
jgi:hypothetical protein